MALKVFPTEFQIYDDESDIVLGTIKAFDEVSLDVEIKQIMSAKDMAELAAVMEKIEQLHKDGM